MCGISLTVQDNCSQFNLLYNWVPEINPQSFQARHRLMAEWGNRLDGWFAGYNTESVTMNDTC
jgi:hypothetical protein